LCCAGTESEAAIDSQLTAQAKATAKWNKRATDIEQSRTDKAKKRAENIKNRTMERRDKKLGPFLALLARLCHQGRGEDTVVMHCTGTWFLTPWP